MICHFYPSINPNNIGKLTNRQYNTLLEQAFNIAGFRLAGKLEYESESDMIKRTVDEFNQLKSSGRWN